MLVLGTGNGQEVLGLVKQLDWLANYPELWKRLQKLDVESISAFVRDFEGKSAVLPFTQAYVPTSLSERMLYGKVWVRSVGTQTTDRRKIWNDFYNEFPPGVTPSIQQLLDKAKEIDDLFGNLFIPPIR